MGSGIEEASGGLLEMQDRFHVVLGLGLRPGQVNVQAGAAALETGRHGLSVDLGCGAQHVGRISELGCD